MNKIIAIVGMCGTGKSVACDYLEKINYKKVYFGGITYGLMKEEGIEITPESETKYRENLRKKYGMGAYATLSLPKIKELVKDNNVVIDGLYSWSELTILNNEFKDNFYVISVVTDKNIRYERISNRPGRSYSKEDAIKRDISEIENIEKGGPIAYADYYIFNNGTINDFNERLKEILKDIEK